MDAAQYPANDENIKMTTTTATIQLTGRLKTSLAIRYEFAMKDVSFSRRLFDEENVTGPLESVL